jgi:hypothetical protein
MSANLTIEFAVMSETVMFTVDDRESNSGGRSLAPVVSNSMETKVIWKYSPTTKKALAEMFNS